MAYLDPASNPESKSQGFSVKTCKSSTSDMLQNDKLFSSATAATLGGTFSKRNH